MATYPAAMILPGGQEIGVCAQELTYHEAERVAKWWEGQKVRTKIVQGRLERYEVILVIGKED